MGLVTKTWVGLALALISGCIYAQQSNSLEPRISAVVNGEPVFQSSVNIISKTIANSDKLEEKAIIGELINLKLLSQAARDMGLDKNNNAVLEISLQLEQALANAYTGYVYKEFEVSDAELDEGYARLLSSNVSRDYRLSHILVERREEALEVIEQIGLGNDFRSVAVEHSIDPVLNSGGDLGWVTYGSSTMQHSNVIEQLELGEVSEPLETDFGWHVFKLTDIRGPELPEFESVENDLREALIKEKMDNHMELLRSSAEISLVER